MQRVEGGFAAWKWEGDRMLRLLLFSVKYRVRPSARKARRWSGNLGSVRRMKENEMAIPMHGKVHVLRRG